MHRLPSCSMINRAAKAHRTVGGTTTQTGGMLRASTSALPCKNLVTCCLPLYTNEHGSGSKSIAGG